MRAIFSKYFNLEYKEFLQEQRLIFVRTIFDLSLQLKDEKKRKQTDELLKGLENPLLIKKKEIRRLVRNLIPIDHSIENSGLIRDDDDLPPSSDIFDVD